MPTSALISFVWTWMRLKSGSLWSGVILHASHNTFIQRFFDPITVDNEKTRYVAGEFGAALYVVALLSAAYFWSRRDELSCREDLSRTSVQPELLGAE
jgi:membrane protease YdiL (CAAX protease family)